MLLRSLLFVPGNRPNMLNKATGFQPDAFIPDMEDSVPINEKENARNIVATHLNQLTDTGSLVIPRVNSIDSGLLTHDLEAVVGPYVFGVSVGKISSALGIKHVSDILDRLEDKNSIERGSIKLIPWIETAEAIVKAYEICTSSKRIVAVAFGAEDFTNDMGIERTENETEVEYPRRSVCIAARAADVLALDTPYFSFKDLEGLRVNVASSRKFGFRGKFAIHPLQVDIINHTLSPSRAEIEYARRVLEAFEAAEQLGRGSTSLDGKVIDVPVVRRAQALLESVNVLNKQNGG